MNLLILTDGITPFVIGGMQKHSYNLVRNLALQGHRITLFHCVTGSNKLPTREDVVELFGADAMKNIESICLRFPAPSWYPGHYLKESYVYSRIIYRKIESRLTEFDFIYAKGFCGWYFLEQKTKGKKLPPVGIKFHGYEMFQKPVGLRMRLENMLLANPVKWNNVHADCVFSYGGKITDLIESLHVDRTKIIEIPTGIDPAWISSAIPQTKSAVKHFCFIGRNERRKGIAELHEAIRKLPAAGFHFHFIGPIPSSSQLRAANITYHGALREPAKIQAVLDSCQVLVTPSHSEGMPNVIMEGMARGLAIVATPVGAVEAVVDTSNGWLIEPGNVEALHRCLENIIGMNNTDLEQKQQASLQRIQNFTWESIARITAQRIGSYRSKA
ncbi:MAG: glycosyltransferase family 4 protein [Flavobacteriales bacterium]|jgi:glycosyltransferase involved in cell wall biosynthesis